MGLIPDDIIRELRERADIVAVIGRHVTLRKAGRNHKGLCPFHQEKTPSFNVNVERGFYYCFGCQQKGDVFSFLMEYEGKSFFEAAEELARLTGVDLPEPESGPPARTQRTERAQMLEVNEMATGFFRRALQGERSGEAARRYLRERGIGEAVAEAFRLGYAPDGWSGLVDFLRERGASLPIAEKVGLIAPRPRAGGHYDRFRDRLMCPVVVPGGTITGFSGRLIGGEEGAKYMNSPESAVYKKSRLLFGLEQARAGFRRAGRAIVVEGNFDVIALHQAGFDETVAPLGTALTPEQAEQLRRLVERVVLLYDGDAAGRAATLKGLQTLVGADLDVEIAEVPAGEDPDTLLRSQGKSALEELLSRTQPAIEYFIDDAWSRAGRTSDGRARALAEIAPVVKNVLLDTKRDFIADTVAKRLGVDAQVVWRALRRQGEDAASPPSPMPAPGVSQPTETLGPPPPLELTVLQILADHPSVLDEAEKLGVFSLLTDRRLRDMYSAARAGTPVVSALPTDASADIARRVLAGDYATLADPEQTLREAVANIRRFRLRAELRRRNEQQTRAADRRVGDPTSERELLREILATRRQVD
jgi:DNA primase